MGFYKSLIFLQSLIQNPTWLDTTLAMLLNVVRERDGARLVNVTLFLGANAANSTVALRRDRSRRQAERGLQRRSGNGGGVGELRIRQSA